MPLTRFPAGRLSLALVAVLLPAGSAAAQGSGPPVAARSAADSAFAALQERGRRAMGVDQYTSTHRFDDLADGGRIELQRNVDDAGGTGAIRAHLRDIQALFTAGDFRIPAMVHDMEVPGTKVMAARKAHLRFTFRELPRGGEVRIHTTDPEALKAVHEFLAFQRLDHRSHGQHHRVP